MTYMITTAIAAVVSVALLVSWLRSKAALRSAAEKLRPQEELAEDRARLEDLAARARADRAEAELARAQALETATEVRRETAEQLRAMAERLRPQDELQTERQWLLRETEALRRDREQWAVQERAARAELELLRDRSQSELSRLQGEIELLEGRGELVSFGLYRPFYDFDSSEKYKLRLDQIRDSQGEMLKKKTAAICGTTWQVQGSAEKGRQMVERILKLQLLAFNGECDSATAKVKYNNVLSLSERIKKSFATINKLGESNDCRIVDRYLELKLSELYLVHEHAEKVQEEKEEQRRIKEQMREEEAAQRELEKAQRDAEKDEQRYEAALEKARAELLRAREGEDAAAHAKIAELEAALARAHEAKERAVSRAQLTRSGHVYVISNEGSFGENIFKVGMTRRLEPMDRVKELGDASVPFPFDVHAIIYSDDAPGLELKLHRFLHERRLNLVNERKEFFQVGLEDIERAVLELHGEIEFTKLAEAQEYRRTRAMRSERASARPVFNADSLGEQASSAAYAAAT